MSDFSDGQKIGGYEILGILGKGGMGTVYKANQTSMDRHVALKVLDPNLASKDPSFCERFIDEARAAGRLNHPNIIGVHDVSNVEVDGEKIYYFSMEIVEGENFKDIIERDGTVPIRVAEQVAIKISDALTYAEQMNIVHRDIKPENIMITKDGVVKLADLGLALQTDGEGVETGKAGEDGKVKVMGTPRYMSPEQCRGKSVDSRTDQYCLGGTLFHMITGVPPYEGKSRKDLMRAQVLEPVPDPAELIDIPEAWRQLLMRMMAKRPEERLPNAEVMGEAIRQAKAGQIYKNPRRGLGMRRSHGNQQSNNVFLYLIIAVVLLATIGIIVSNSETTPVTPTPTPGPEITAEERLRQQAREIIGRTSVDDNASISEIRSAIVKLNDILEQGIFKNGDAGYQIIQNETQRLEKQLVTRSKNRQNDLLREIKQAEVLINSGKFAEAQKALNAFNDADKKMVAVQHKNAFTQLHKEIESKYKQIISSIERANTPGEIDNTIKEAKIKQVYNFRKKQIDAAAHKRRGIVNKIISEQNKQNAAANRRQDQTTWKNMIADLKKHRGTYNFNGFIATAEKAHKSLKDDKLKAAAKSYADIGRSANNTDKTLNEYLKRSKPSFALIGSKLKNVRCIGLDKEHYIILVNPPNETAKHVRQQENIPVVSFLNGSLSTRNARQRNNIIGLYLNYWNHPSAGQYPNPFPRLDVKKFPLKDFPQLSSIKTPTPFTNNVYEVDFAKPGIWQGQFAGKNASFTGKSLNWSIDQAIGGSPKNTPENKLNFQTLAYKPPIKGAASIDLKLRLSDFTFGMIGLRRGRFTTRVVMNSNDDVLGAVISTNEGKISVRPPESIPATKIVRNDIDLQINIDKNSKITFYINGKKFTKFKNASKEQFSLPGKGDVQLVFQGFKISPNNNGAISIKSLKIKQNR